MITCSCSSIFSFLITVVEMKFRTFVGEHITVPDDIIVIIDCGPKIDNFTMEGGVIKNVTWSKNGRPIVNDTEVNVVLAPDNRTITITDTLRGTPAQVGTEGDYCCEVNSVNESCTDVDVCSKLIF